jgi:YHS domain-containing protein
MLRHLLRARRLVTGAILSVVAWLGLSAGRSPIFAGETDAVLWRDDYALALEEARTLDRLLWIQFTGPWCPNCVRMERDTFPVPAIVQHAQTSFIPVKLRSDVHEQLALQFNLTGLPATILLAPNREILSVYQGYLGPDELDSLLRQALKHRPDAPRRPAEQAATTNGTGPGQEAGEPERKPPAPLALLGYCPVSLVVQRKLVLGQPAYSTEHEGHTYHLASSEMRERFRMDPARYAPANDGQSAVYRLDRCAAVAGNPHWGVIYRGRLFVCASEEDRRQFMTDPDRYAAITSFSASRGGLR